MTPGAPERCDLLIEAGWVVPVEPHGVVLEGHAVAIRGAEIVAVLPAADARARFAISHQAGCLHLQPTHDVPATGSRLGMTTFVCYEGH